ncbi:hypothetical protein K466DRAFT_370998 [Polyporus arcularius HHB13444]|uniref:Uncharacterized protein n=1 Tax=Polyporus arcularius HHB13444 TaxID=1314778 RepID=A0A5C3PLQ3_9APHY|nr:hypothetical protein K466DRAFT_370998 [Polyporus arcularius HHB13444]
MMEPHKPPTRHFPAIVISQCPVRLRTPATLDAAHAASPLLLPRSPRPSCAAAQQRVSASPSLRVSSRSLSMIRARTGRPFRTPPTDPSGLFYDAFRAPPGPNARSAHAYIYAITIIADQADPPFRYSKSWPRSASSSRHHHREARSSPCVLAACSWSLCMHPGIRRIRTRRSCSLHNHSRVGLLFTFCSSMSS